MRWSSPHPFDCWCNGCIRRRQVRIALPIWVAAVLLAVALVIAFAATGCISTQSRPTPPHPTPPNRPPVLLALEVQVADADGPPLPGAVVTILDNANAGKKATANSLGRALLTGLQVAGQTVCAELEGYVTACEPKTLLTSGNLTIRLHKAKPTPPGARVVRSRIRATSTQLLYADGQPFRWKGITAFALLEQVAHGREAEAVAWMRTERARGFSVARVLAMNRGWLELSPEDGRRALPRLLELAAAEDIHILVTALSASDTRTPAFLEAQVKAVGAACAANVACVAVEIANEPYSGSQHASLYRPDTMARLRKLIPREVIVGYGATRTDGARPGADELLDSAVMQNGAMNDGRYLAGDGADVVFIHRKRVKDVWDDLRRYSEMHKLARKVNKVVIDDEPFGFAELPRVGTNDRRTEAYVGYGQGSLSTLFGIPSTFHAQDGLLTKPLGPKQAAAAAAFIAGVESVPDGVVFRWVNAKAGDSAVKDASFIGPSCSGCNVMRGFSFFSSRGNFLAWVGLQPTSGNGYSLPNRDPRAIWQNGWRVKSVVAEHPGYQVVELTR